MKAAVDPRRVLRLRGGSPGKGPVLYWMSRDQRALDNWALLHAQELSRGSGRSLAAVFCLAPSFLGASARHYRFMLDGLRETEGDLSRRNITLVLLRGRPPETLAAAVRRWDASAVVTDFDPLRVKRRWRAALCRLVDVPVHEVDAHNIVPCRAASPKQEYAARTFRPRVRRLLPEFLTAFPPLRKERKAFDPGEEGTDWEELRRRPPGRGGAEPAPDWIAPGAEAALRGVREFVSRRLDRYDEDRNDPNRDGQSGLSPWLHFGHLSAQRAALEVRLAAGDSEAAEAFLEELVVRRELADNFCHHQRRYDSIAAFPRWARETLERHRDDRRPHLYGRRRLEAGRTHDELWNAAQREMVERGKMHGYLRMYWAKKILEWSASPEKALATAVALNDRYELDGRDPSGYAGIAWSIGGVHDRPWPERPVFGTVRSMSLAGCRSRFDVDAYCRRWS